MSIAFQHKHGEPQGFLNFYILTKSNASRDLGQKILQKKFYHLQVVLVGMKLTAMIFPALIPAISAHINGPKSIINFRAFTNFHI